MKNKTYGYIALVIGLIVFNVIALVIPVDHTSAFWTVFAFTNAAFVAQLVIWKRAFKKANGLKSKFLGIPIAYVGILYLIAQIICFAVIVANNASAWVSIVSSVAILGISGLLMIAGEISRNAVGKVEQKVNDSTVFLRDLRIKIDSLIVDEKDPEIRVKLQELAEVARYCNQRSTNATNDIENDIINLLNGELTEKNISQGISMLKKREIVMRSDC